MARRGLNKSAAIRDMINQNPKAKTSEIVSLLAGKGIHTGRRERYNLGVLSDLGQR
jgi:hypothetical protein